MAETDLSTWHPIADAALILGCSIRTVERLAAAKKLEARLRRQEGTPPVAVFSPESVAEEAQRRRQRPAPFVLPAVQAGNGNGHGPVAKTARPPWTNFDEARAAMVAVVTDLARSLHPVLSPPSPPMAATVAETGFLTLAEASAFIRLPQADLRRLVAAGELAVRKTGRGGLRFRRKDLEAL